MKLCLKFGKEFESIYTVPQLNCYHRQGLNAVETSMVAPSGPLLMSPLKMAPTHWAMRVMRVATIVRMRRAGSRRYNRVRGLADQRRRETIRETVANARPGRAWTRGKLPPFFIGDKAACTRHICLPMTSTMARDGKLSRNVFPFVFFKRPFGVAGHQQLRAWQAWGSCHQQRDYYNKSNESHV